MQRVPSGWIITNAQINNSRLNAAGTSGSVLTNPTLTTPTLDDPSLTGTIAIGGAADDVGFYDATPVAQQSALTTQHAALTQAGTDNGDVTIQAATSTTPFGFVNADEFEAVVACVVNLMTRVQELEDALQAYGLLA